MQLTASRGASKAIVAHLHYMIALFGLLGTPTWAFYLSVVHIGVYWDKRL